MNKVLAFVVLACVGVPAALSQGASTASRAGDLQLGGGFSMANSDYTTNNLQGFMLYGTFDFRDWLGVEASFHNTTAGDGTGVYERTYEIGPRVVYDFNRTLHPYAKVLVGRGVFNYPPDCLDKTTNQPTSCTAPNVDPSTKGASANLAYNEVAFGAGIDFHVHPRINVRLDYEYQDWMSFEPNGLTPQVFSIGVAYHFGSGDLSIR